MKPKLAIAEKAPQRTEAERLHHLDVNLTHLAEHLNELAPHLSDLGNLLYEKQDLSKPISTDIVQAVSTLLEEYSKTVADYGEWATELAAEAAGTEQK